MEGCYKCREHDDHKCIWLDFEFPVHDMDGFEKNIHVLENDYFAAMNIRIRVRNISIAESPEMSRTIDAFKNLQNVHGLAMDVTTMSICDVNTIVFATRHLRITKLHLSSDKGRACQVVHIIKYYPTIRQLVLCDVRVTKSTVKEFSQALSRMTRLREISLQNVEFENDECLFNVECALREHDIHAAKLSIQADVPFAAMRSFMMMLGLKTNLEYLSIGRYMDAGEWLRNMSSGFKSLRTLRLDKCMIAHDPNKTVFRFIESHPTILNLHVDIVVKQTEQECIAHAALLLPKLRYVFFNIDERSEMESVINILKCSESITRLTIMCSGEKMKLPDDLNDVLGRNCDRMIEEHLLFLQDGA